LSLDLAATTNRSNGAGDHPLNAGRDGCGDAGPSKLTVVVANPTQTRSFLTRILRKFCTTSDTLARASLRPMREVFMV
jgi:hypothetical protein